MPSSILSLTITNGKFQYERNQIPEYIYMLYICIANMKELLVYVFACALNPIELMKCTNTSLSETFCHEISCWPK